MKKKINSHYLSITYKSLINNKIIHHILFIIEIFLLTIQIIEIYYNDYNTFIKADIKILSPLTLIIININKLPIKFNFIIYFVIISIIVISYFLLNIFRFKINCFIIIIVNITEVIFYRLLSLLIFNYLFIFRGIFLVINTLLILSYLYILINNFSTNYLFLFFPSILDYPYDAFSMIIDITLLIIKIFVSISSMTSNKSVSKFGFIISIFFLLVLLFYLSYIMKNKSYYFMNNCNLNKLRYTFILSICIIIIVIIIFDKKYINNIYYQICYFNFIFLCLIFIYCFYDPYKYFKFDKDDNIENVYYYFFIFEKFRNNFLFEEKIEEHLSLCNKCNLCKKYNEFKKNNQNNNIDLYNIIYNGKNISLNIMNNIFKGIIKNGKSSFVNNSFYLINLIYIYHLCIKEQNYNSLSNIELLFEIINKENSQFIEEHKISLNQIKNSNNFLIKANNIISAIYELINDKNFPQNIFPFFKLAEELKQLKLKDIKSVNNRNINNTNNIEGLPNCNNILAICSLFYEELYNESLSNSGNFIKDTPNLIDDLINSNNKNRKQITLKIDIPNFNATIIRAGGYLNKYENKNFFDFFPSIFKNNQIINMRDLLLDSNSNLKQKTKKNSQNEFNKKKQNKKQVINFNFIFEEKEDNTIFYKELKLKLNLILLTNIDITIYLNGTYTIDKNIIVTEQQKMEEEIVLYYGNKDQINKIKIEKKKNINNRKIFIKTINKNKFLGNDKLMENSKTFIGHKKYTVYHILSSSRLSILDKGSKKNIMKDEKHKIEEDKTELYDENNQLFFYNELASQASSTTTSMSKNNLMSYYRVNKKTQHEENYSRNFKISKYIILVSIFVFLILDVFEFIYSNLFQNKLIDNDDFYLSLKEYSYNFNILFFSVMTLICIADPNYSNKCLNLINEINNMEIANINIDDSNNNRSQCINYTELLIIQNEIMYKNLNSKLSIINKYLAIYSKEKFSQNLQSNIKYTKINQILKNNTIYLSSSKENIIFFDFIKLMNSRFGIIMNNYDYMRTPIYILNKNGIEAFKNISPEQKIDSSQEAIYLVILDYKSFIKHFEKVISQFVLYIKASKTKIKIIIYCFINLNFFLIIIIIIILSVHIIVYLFLVFQIINDISINLKEKVGDILIKDIIRNKIDNLKLLLKFYENDINKIMKELNIIYNDYKNNYNLKIKEGTRLLKKEGKNEMSNKNKNVDLASLIKIFRKYNLLKYLNKRNIFIYSLSLIFLLNLVIYFINISLWAQYLQKDLDLYFWINGNHELNTITTNLMNNLLLMIYQNQTITELTKNESNNYIFYIYSKLANFYGVHKYEKSLSDIVIQKKVIINYDCSSFFLELKDDTFDQLKDKFVNESEKLYNTMINFCISSKIMSFNDDKTIYLHLFSKVKKIIENFPKGEYNDIIQYIQNYSIAKIQIMFLTIFKYIFDISFNNTKYSLLIMSYKAEKLFIIFGITNTLLIAIFLIIIYFVYIKNINNDVDKFISARKIFKVCDTNE